MTSFFRNGNSPPKARDNSHPRTPEKSRQPFREGLMGIVEKFCHRARRASLTPSKPGPTLFYGEQQVSPYGFEKIFRQHVAGPLHSISHSAGGLLSKALPKGSST